MSWLDSVFQISSDSGSYTYQPENKIAAARSALMYYHNRECYKYPSVYKYTFDQFLDAIGGGNPQKTTTILEGLGGSILSIQQDGFLSDTQIRDAMEDLADKSEGRIPASYQTFFNVLGGKAQDVSFLDAAWATAKGTTEKVAGGVKEIGETAIAVGSSLNVVAPILIFGAIIFIFYSRTRQVAGR